MSRLDMGLGFSYRVPAHLCAWAALIFSTLDSFQPSYFTEMCLWASITFFALDKPVRRIK